MRHTTFYAIVASAVLAAAPVQAHFVQVHLAASIQPAQDSPSQNDLRQENDQLQRQVKMLKDELAAAKQQVKELQDRLAQLEKMASGVQQSTPAAEVLPDPAIGPGGLLSKLRNEFATAFQDKDIPVSGPGADAPSQQAWAAYQRAVEPWITRFDRNGMDVRWTGSIDPASVQQTGRSVTMTIVFTNGGRDFPASVTVDEGMVARLHMPDGSLTSDPVVVNAIVQPRLRINPARRDAGAFEKPPLVGPYVEFGYDIKPKVILTPEKARQLQPKNGQNGAPPSNPPATPPTTPPATGTP